MDLDSDLLCFNQRIAGPQKKVGKVKTFFTTLLDALNTKREGENFFFFFLSLCLQEYFGRIFKWVVYNLDESVSFPNKMQKLHQQ